MSGPCDEPAWPGDELVDIVDDDDRVVATVTRRRDARRRGCATAPCSSPCVGSDGRLLVHRRSEAKDLWPGRWDVAVGGVVGGRRGLRRRGRARELAEEVGVDRGQRRRRSASGATPTTTSTSLARCYRVVHDGPFRFVDGEVVEARWVDRRRAGRADGRGESFVPDSLALLPVDVPFRRAGFRFPSRLSNTQWWVADPRRARRKDTTMSGCDRRRRRAAGQRSATTSSCSRATSTRSSRPCSTRSATRCGRARPATASRATGTRRSRRRSAG